MMNRLAVFLALIACFSFCIPVSAGENPEKAVSERRVERVSWNAVTCELSWSVSEGERNAAGEFVPAKVHNYSINMDQATMTYKASTRRFSRDEAVQVHAILNALKSYAEQSTDWWKAGKGERVDLLARVLE